MSNLDPVFVVFRDFGKNGLEGLCYPEHTRRKVVDLYRSGEWENVVKILEVNEAEGTSRNILEDVHNEAAMMLQAAE
jgi:hypothetical protein